MTYTKKEIDIKTVKAEIHENNENLEKTDKPKKSQNYEKSSTDNLEVKNMKKLSNSSMEDVSLLKAFLIF